MESIPRTFRLRTLVLGILAAFGLGVMLSLLWNTPGAFTQSRALRLQQSIYPLINPLLLCNVYEPQNNNEDKKLETAISEFIKEKKTDEEVSAMSVYLIQYKTGQWVGVNENDRYDPASMLKVPIMLAYYHAAEQNPSLLKRTVQFNGDDQNTEEYFKSPDTIKPGKTYTIEQLIESMIINSDNTAAVLLQHELDQSALAETYTDLGLPLPESGPNVQYLTPKLYAFFLRVLYNSTYLSNANSQKALELMAKSKVSMLRDGLKDTIVADKFGERTLQNTQGVVLDRELHDCGIIYKKDNPYLLCVMSQGNTNDFPTLQKNITDLSALVYENI